MVTKKKYSVWIAAFLLGLYVFIATPVQFWHQHTYTVSYQDQDPQHEDAFATSDGKAVDANCQICAHHYAVYTNDSHAVIEMAANSYAVTGTSPVQSLPAGSAYYLPGRGPPTV